GRRRATTRSCDDRAAPVAVLRVWRRRNAWMAAPENARGSARYDREVRSSGESQSARGAWRGRIDGVLRRHPETAERTAFRDRWRRLQSEQPRAPARARLRLA